MADFVAVIRRAVDGLSDNTPEMRVKVYEKARSAVLRQLESMKPRPAEEMLRRQLDKLEAAIVEVEAEHTEALPAEDEPEALEPDVASAEPPPEAVPVHGSEPDAGAQPLAHDPAEGSAPTTESDRSEVEPADQVSVDQQVPEAVSTDTARDDVRAEQGSQVVIHGRIAASGYRPAVVEHHEEPAAATRPISVSRSAPLLWEDETWAGEEEASVYREPEAMLPEPAEQVEPEPVSYVEPEPQAPEPAVEEHSLEPAEDHYPEPVADRYVEPVADHYVEPAAEHSAEPVTADEPDWLDVAPAEARVEPLVVSDYWQEPEEQDVPVDFPIAEPTTQYGQPEQQEPVETASVDGPIWPDDGVSATATARVARERWTGSAVYQPQADEPLADVAPAEFAAYEEAQAEPAAAVDPLGWQQFENDTQAIQSEPAEFVEVATVQGELAAAAQDSFDEPMLHGQVYPEPATDVVEPVLADAVDHFEQAQLYPAEAEAETELQSFEPAVETPQVADRANQAQDDVEWGDSPFTDVPLPTEGEGQRGEDNYDAEWDEYRDFVNSDKGAPAEEDYIDSDFVPAAADKPARSYRIQQRRRIDFTSMGLGLLGLALVAGSGYGAWTFRDTLSGLVTGLVSTPPAETPKPAAEQTPEKPADTGAAAGTGIDGAGTAPAVPSDLASAEPDIQKFTQRLQPDGSEIEGGSPSGSEAEGEGRSVAAQTVASSQPVDATTQLAPGSTAAGAGATIPVGVSQKMFLYEERVGQTSPVAVEGAVVWSLKHEKAENGKDEAVVQAQVSSPERGLSALISFKRNLDPSLPASHLVELVFSLPKEFEGGAIESVQRVALKQTEQDRGDPLIAVPAKITDDFHMIALNDYADAREFNLKLLQTRNWIDIPVTYRNGRRALITMEKGSSGAEAFNQAIREWRALDPSTTAVPANTPAPAPAAANPQ